MLKRRWLRPMPRISYYEPEEPDLDEYIFCEKCADYVYEYCSIHGPLLVIPDDKVPAKHNFPPCVPRAALTIPKVFLHLNYSTIPGAGLGVFTTMALPQGVRFGPYRGVSTKQVTSDYCWQIYGRDRKPSHVVDASDGDKSNWMRFVNCARHWREQNLVAFQYQGQLYYRTIKIIPRFTELMVFYGSEFAKNLHINLGKYNAPKSYAQKFGARPNKPKVIENQKANKETKTPAKEKEIKSAVTEPVIPKFPAKKRPKENPSETHKEVPAAKKRKTEKPRTAVTIRQGNKEHAVKPSKNKNESVKKTETKSVTANSKDLNSDDNTDWNINQKPQKAVQNDSTKNTDINCTVSVDNAVITKDTIRKENVPVIVEVDNVPSNDDNEKENLPANKKQFIVTSNDQIEKQNAPTNTLKKLDDINRKGRLIIDKDTPDLYFSCNLCNYRSVAKQSLEKHMRFHDVNRKFVCEICGYRFHISVCLNRHIRIHEKNDVEVLGCNVNEVAIKQSLENDLKTSGGEKHTNNAFNKKITQKGLSTNLTMHSIGKSFPCHVCNHKSKRAGNLKTHMLVHSRIKPYTCNVCSKSFKIKSNLKKHLMIHGELKPYQCNVCDYKTNQVIVLKRHLRVHTGEKPYTCNTCDFRTSNASSLKYHLQVHSDEKPYSCDICDYKCIEKKHLNNHLKRKHLS